MGIQKLDSISPQFCNSFKTTVWSIPILRICIWNCIYFDHKFKGLKILWIQLNQFLIRHLSFVSNKKLDLIFLNLNFANNYEIPFRLCEYVILFILVHKDLSNFRCPNLNQLNRHCSNSNLSTAAFITAGWLGNLIHDSQQQKKSCGSQ